MWRNKVLFLLHLKLLSHFAVRQHLFPTNFWFNPSYHVGLSLSTVLWPLKFSCIFNPRNFYNFASLHVVQRTFRSSTHTFIIIEEVFTTSNTCNHITCLYVTCFPNDWGGSFSYETYKNYISYVLNSQLVNYYIMFWYDPFGTWSAASSVMLPISQAT